MNCIVFFMNYQCTFFFQDFRLMFGDNCQLFYNYMYFVLSVSAFIKEDNIKFLDVFNDFLIYDYYAQVLPVLSFGTFCQYPVLWVL